MPLGVIGWLSVFVAFLLGSIFSLCLSFLLALSEYSLRDYCLFTLRLLVEFVGNVASDVKFLLVASLCLVGCLLLSSGPGLRRVPWRWRSNAGC